MSITTTTATRRSALARRADAGTIAAYVRQESSRAARRARPSGRPPCVVRRQRPGGVPAGRGAIPVPSTTPDSVLV